ncbi:transcriptional regulator [Limnohabitans sp. 2KL-1]|uniref:type II toxin-antitoxin system HipA family toxin YjjJ n=1 Tax=Limnohabitans sp. 2KL-1 TaxID=1100699 RepID=UPI000D390BD4|nr:type II toxin-antitoxin system HipA family toxin YjjJ [Limnohabitans sp. 2KL-1]PUE50215.1 transcriptional regulator [Limnohabitans sp. 2KL-1]
MTTTETLTAALRRHNGHASSPELQVQLGVSQPTMSRLLAPLLATGQVVKVGAARAQRYLLPRDVPGVGRHVLIHQVQPGGELQAFGTLYPLVGGGFWMEETDKAHGQSAFHPSLPWFLMDTRPQGFLGRAFAQTHAELALPPHLAHWSDDHILQALVRAGEDLPGNLLVGGASLDRYLALPASRSAAPEVTDPAQDYPRLALQALGSAAPGSSAGGEQPKFGAVTDGVPVLVKFSPAGDAPADQRWRDLLVCEALALQTLQTAGIAAAQTDIVQAAGRVFLQSRRFDRTAQGRVGMVSLEMYDAHYIGIGSQWAATAMQTSRAGAESLSAADIQTLCLLDAFGALIANTDRHHGNVSLLLLHQHRWQLAPAYDMLPMYYAPVAGEVVERNWASQLPRPNAHTLSVWPQAKALAFQFWQSAASDVRISEEFRAVAKVNEGLVNGL